MLGKDYSPEGGGHGIGPHSSGHDPRPAKVQGLCGQCFQTWGLNFVWSWVEPGVGFNNPCRFFLMWDTT